LADGEASHGKKHRYEERRKAKEAAAAASITAAQIADLLSAEKVAEA